MKILLATAATLSLLAAAPAFAQAGPVETANANASADIVVPLAIVAGGTPLAFGSLAANDTPSTITISNSGARSDPDGVVIASSGAGSAANFNVSGQGTLAYTVTLDAGATLTSGANSMSVTGLNTDDTSRNLTAGADSFSVGGTLNVGANQAAGSYTGTFAANVQYD